MQICVNLPSRWFSLCHCSACHNPCQSSLRSLRGNATLPTSVPQNSTASCNFEAEGTRKSDGSMADGRIGCDIWPWIAGRLTCDGGPDVLCLSHRSLAAQVCSALFLVFLSATSGACSPRWSEFLSTSDSKDFLSLLCAYKDPEATEKYSRISFLNRQTLYLSIPSLSSTSVRQ